MSHLTHYLLARIREDEALAHRAARGPEDSETWQWQATITGMHGNVETAGGQAVAAYSDMDEGVQDEDIIAAPLGADVASYISWFDPARILWECRSKRRLIELHEDHAGGSCSTLLVMAQAYSGRADFPNGWRDTSPGRRAPEARSRETHLWHEVDELAQARQGSYDTHAIVEEIEVTFGPSSLLGVPPVEIERLFVKHEIYQDR